MRVGPCVVTVCELEAVTRMKVELQIVDGQRQPATNQHPTIFAVTRPHATAAVGMWGKN